MSTPPVALVTGANKGIGFETARQLGRLGMTILLGARSRVRGETAEQQLRDDGIDVRYVEVDLEQSETFQPLFDLISREFGRLDVLIQNAAVAEELGSSAIKPASTVSMEILRHTFEINFFQTVALTQSLLPLIKRSAAGRIVFLSSILGSLTIHSDPKSSIYNFKVPAYNISKTALNGYVVHLAHELRQTPIKVNAAHPGSVKTDMNPSGELSVEDGAKTSVMLATLPEDGFTGKLVHRDQIYPW